MKINGDSEVSEPPASTSGESDQNDVVQIRLKQKSVCASPIPPSSDARSLLSLLMPAT